MATNINRTELVGNLGNDPEARYSAAGTLVVTANIAVHSSFKQGEEWKERTDWFRLVAFGEAGEYLASYHKGERIQVLGRLQSSEYTDREGQKRTSVEVVVLRSDPAPLARRAPVETEPEAADAAEEPVLEAEAPAEPAEEPAPKSRRRR
ncbi:MAG: single-stranded DNA-binding protein, partial [Chloroflexales bacterium]|nr:single-stranded DNA-binding protein [Chloroflexales bacterium]